MVLTCLSFLDTDAYDREDLILDLQEENVDIDDDVEIPRFEYIDKNVYNTTHFFKTGKLYI